MNNGFIVIWRKFLDTSFYKDSFAVHLALHLIMQANHEPNKFTFNRKEESLERGQLLTGRKALSFQTGISESTVTHKLELLENIGFLTRKTNNRFTIITICNYNRYQSNKKKVEQRSIQPSNSQVTASEQPSNTNNNITIKQLNNTIVPQTGTNKVFDYFCLKYKETLKVDYVANFGKDKKLIKDLLGVVKEDELLINIDNFFKSDDEFIQKSGYTLGVFKSQINKLRGKKPADPFADCLKKEK